MELELLMGKGRNETYLVQKTNLFEIPNNWQVDVVKRSFVPPCCHELVMCQMTIASVHFILVFVSHPKPSEPGCDFETAVKF